MNLSEKIFYGKILLFGEYSVVLGSKALSLPYRKVGGKLELSDLKNANEVESNRSIRKLFNFIGSNDLKRFFHIHKFSDYLDNGLIFNSNIPQGYGVGSSGALVAAIYYEFGNSEIKLDNYELKKLFGEIESFFHGKSSGLDPLICFLNKPILVKADKSLDVFDDIDIFELDFVSLELIDSGEIGKTEPLVNLFLEKCKNDEFKVKIENELAFFSDKAIDYFLNKNAEDLFEQILKISSFEFENFKEMIPKSFKEIWRNSINPKEAIKLCGSGGGGYFLKFKKIE